MLSWTRNISSNLLPFSSQHTALFSPHMVTKRENFVEDLQCWKKYEVRPDSFLPFFPKQDFTKPTFKPFCAKDSLIIFACGLFPCVKICNGSIVSCSLWQHLPLFSIRKNGICGFADDPLRHGFIRCFLF